MSLLVSAKQGIYWMERFVLVIKNSIFLAFAAFQLRYKFYISMRLFE